MEQTPSIEKNPRNEVLLAAGSSYRSILFFLPSSDPEYEGQKTTLAEAFIDLETTLKQRKSLKKSEEPSAAMASRLVMRSARIVRGLIDWKIEHEDSSELVVPFIREAIDLCEAVYSSDPDASRKLNVLRTRIRKSKHASSLLSFSFVQPQLENISLNALTSDKLARAAENLRAETNGDNVLFIAIAHGGVASGMDVYLRYCDAVKSTNSKFYAVRFSYYKNGDRNPCLSEEEVAYLRAEAKERKIVLFDEDYDTGRTLEHAQIYFSSNVFNGRSLLVAQSKRIKR